jgi:hypothetical protein
MIVEGAVGYLTKDVTTIGTTKEKVDMEMAFQDGASFMDTNTKSLFSRHHHHHKYVP